MTSSPGQLILQSPGSFEILLGSPRNLELTAPYVYLKHRGHSARSRECFIRSGIIQPPCMDTHDERLSQLPLDLFPANPTSPRYPTRSVDIIEFLLDDTRVVLVHDTLQKLGRLLNGHRRPGRQHSRQDNLQKVEDVIGSGCDYLWLRKVWSGESMSLR